MKHWFLRFNFCPTIGGTLTELKDIIVHLKMLRNVRKHLHSSCWWEMTEPTICVSFHCRLTGLLYARSWVSVTPSLEGVCCGKHQTDQRRHFLDYCDNIGPWSVALALSSRRFAHWTCCHSTGLDRSRLARRVDAVLLECVLWSLSTQTGEKNAHYSIAASQHSGSRRRPMHRAISRAAAAAIAVHFALASY